MASHAVSHQSLHERSFHPFLSTPNAPGRGLSEYRSLLASMVIQPAKPTSEAISASLYACAIITTALRIIRRSRARLFWWDDAFAAASMVSIAISLTVMLMWEAIYDASARLALNWLDTLSFSNTLWLSRISMILCLVRLIPPVLALRSKATLFAFIFPFFWLSIVIHKICICYKERDWMVSHICHQTPFIIVQGLIMDIIADFALCFFPLRMFWQLTESRSRYRGLLMLFSASILTTITSIIHAWAVLGPTGALEDITSSMEASTSVIVCNLAIIVTWIIRSLGLQKQSTEMEDYLSTVIVDDQPHTCRPINVIVACGHFLPRGSRLFRLQHSTEVHDLEAQQNQSQSMDDRRVSDSPGCDHIGASNSHHVILEQASKTEELCANLLVSGIES